MKWQCPECKGMVEVVGDGYLVVHSPPDKLSEVCFGSGHKIKGAPMTAIRELTPADLAVVARIVRTCAGQAYDHILTSMLVAINQAINQPKPPETELRDPLAAYHLGYRRGVADALESAKKGKESFQV